MFLVNNINFSCLILFSEIVPQNQPRTKILWFNLSRDYMKLDKQISYSEVSALNIAQQCTGKRSCVRLEYQSKQKIVFQTQSFQIKSTYSPGSSYCSYVLIFNLTNLRMDKIRSAGAIIKTTKLLLIQIRTRKIIYFKLLK